MNQTDTSTKATLTAEAPEKLSATDLLSIIDEHTDKAPEHDPSDNVWGLVV